MLDLLKRPEGKLLELKRDYSSPDGALKAQPLQMYTSSSRRLHLISEGPVAGINMRVGSTNRRADAELIEELRRF